MSHAVSKVFPNEKTFPPNTHTYTYKYSIHYTPRAMNYEKNFQLNLSHNYM